MKPRWQRPAHLLRVTALIVVALGAGRVIATYRVLSQTSDEPGHIAGGMNWLDRGELEYRGHICWAGARRDSTFSGSRD